MVSLSFITITLLWCFQLLIGLSNASVIPTVGNDVDVDVDVDYDHDYDPVITDLLYLDICQADEQNSQIGTIVIGLFGETVPKTVENFKLLAPIYQDTKTLFHRVIPNFVIQAGDIDHKGGHSIYGDKGALPPVGADPTKFGPYYSGLEDENFIISHNKTGRVSVANAGPNTGGSQFFICLGPQEYLDGKHVVFGQVIKGMDLAKRIAAVKRNEADKPIVDIYINSAHTEEYKNDALSNSGVEFGNSEPTSFEKYTQDHPDGLGGSYHHFVFVPFVVFIIVALLLSYKNRRNVLQLVRGPRYRRISGINVQ